MLLQREVRELVSYHLKSTARFAEHDVHNVFEKAICYLGEAGFVELRGKRILDLGCGQRYAFALQCAAAGADVTALDINYVKPDNLPLAFYRTIQHNGLKRALKSALRRVFFDSRYYHALEANADRSLRKCQSNINFVVADPASSVYPLPSDSFHLIASNAVLEHVQNVRMLAFEVSRLLTKDGCFYAIIHNFYSISGGHNLEWAFPDEHPSNKVPPWDHLRENRFPEFTFLNRHRPEQYKDAFAEHLQILSFKGVGINHELGQLEGERFLTKEIARELAEYPRELLLSRSWCMICRKT